MTGKAETRSLMTGPFLLDTCAWLDAFAAPELLKPAVTKRIQAERTLFVATISLLEVARKEARGELIFGMPLAVWFQRALPAGRVNLIELSSEIAVDATRLPGWPHKDPADQIIVATARIHQLEILTSDGKILSYPHVRSTASRKA